MRPNLTLPEADKDMLFAIAQQRGDRGVSHVVQEAIALYLTERSRPAELAPVPPPLGRWQRLGAALDRRLDGFDEAPRGGSLVGAVRALVRGGLRRIIN